MCCLPATGLAAASGAAGLRDWTSDKDHDDADQARGGAEALSRIGKKDGGAAVWQCDWIRILWHSTAYKALVAQLASRSMADPKLFGCMLTTQDTESRFVSCLNTSTQSNSFIKLKVCWERAELKQVWMMSGQCGLLVEVTDLMPKEEDPSGGPSDLTGGWHRLEEPQDAVALSWPVVAIWVRFCRIFGRWL
ncbi:hypothetical protein AK812_SmicGene18254 [Symbiodinium microadriaticum]|uniref:Uncharacterized protein n=1 Tax=Symbiodinium microadriaticum TaxID=2951 RepID=A0A1Q9DVP1_SYMMI|nr:hypothetical protein AK812_SmicGene18254 [Symbiodinium microadriaticum]